MDACWALSYLSDGSSHAIQCVVDTQVTPALVRCLCHGDTHVVTAALRTLGNIVSGTDAQTQCVVDAGIFECAGKLLEHERRNIRKEVCWMLSNIAAGTKEQTQAIATQAQLVAGCIMLMDESGSFDVRKEAAWVICNITSSKNDVFIVDLVERGALYQLCGLLEAQDVRLVHVVLDALTTILSVRPRCDHLCNHSETNRQWLQVGRAAGHNQYEILMDECEGIDKLERLQEHQDVTIYNKIVSILEEFFAADDAEDENVAPIVSENGKEFVFGTSANALSCAT
eukprot:scaffold803_cov310-Pinguiococcus_pyrenoidosus.AAC.108